MAIDVRTARSVPARADMVAVLVTPADVEAANTEVDWAAAKAQGFDGKVGSTALIGAGNGAVSLLVGVGADDRDHASVRKAGAALAKAAKRGGHVAVDVSDFADTGDAVQAFTEGLRLGAYSYTELKSDPKKSKLKRVSLVGTDRGATAALRRAEAIAHAVNWARDQVNRPGGSLTPAAFADEASAMAKEAGLAVKVMTKPAIERAKLGGLLGVNRGSSNHPRLVQLTYAPTGRARGHVVLVGKGLTFDSGGLSIKTGTGMMTMKCDMGGGAAVLGAMGAIAAVKPKVKVTCIVPMTDNMTGPDATRPGDVLRARNGKTIEVLNTDAEGRLVLADGLSLASEMKPHAIVDCATLTGACMVALGKNLAGVMGNNDAWTGQVADAAGRAGESMWKLPLPKDYRSLLDSPIADLKNIGGSYGGALTAGLFLQEFVADDIPWAHVDLAGPAFADAENGEHPKGGTGYGVRMLVELVEAFEKP